MTPFYRRPWLLWTAVIALGPAAALAQAPAGQVSAGTTRADSSARPAPPVRPVRQSWTSDRRAFAVGDIITVLVDEYTLASADKTTSAVDSRRRDAAVAFTPPASGGVGRTTAADFGTSMDAESREDGEASRANSFRGEMSVRVVAIGANGLLQLKGRKLVNVDKYQQELTLMGWARPQDISSRNTVDSWRLGDGELVYATKGGKPKGGLISRIVALIWP